MATGYSHAAFESIPGNETNTPTLSTKVLYEPVLSLDAKLNPKPLERDDELRNVDEPLMVLPEIYAPEWSIEERGYPDSLGFELKNILGPPTTTAGNGVITDPDSVVIPTGATRHVWTAPYGPTGPSPLTMQRQLAYKDESVYYKLKGCATSELSLATPETGGMQVKASGPALYMTDISDPALTPAYETLTIPPFLRPNLVVVTWLAGSAVFEDFDLSISNPVEVVRTLGIASRYPDLVEKDAGPIVVSGSAVKRHIDPDDWSALKNATGFTIKARWESTVVIGATSYKYTLWFEANNAQYMDGGADALANKRRIGASFPWKATYAGTPGSSKFTLVNNTASYS